MSASVAPLTAAERIDTLDAIRGIALLGIFIMNMPYFNASFFAGADGTDAWPQWWDKGAALIRDVIFSGKFNSMFSMLFAIGFTIQLERLAQREPTRAVAIYCRRLFWLLVFGLLHACLLWIGDILHMYALLGFSLLLFRKFSDRALLIVIVLCLLYPAIGGVVRMNATSEADLIELGKLSQQWLTVDNAVYAHGSYWDIVVQNTRMMILTYTDARVAWGNLGGYAQILTTMLIGLLLGRHRFFQNVAIYLPIVRRVQWWALGIGLVCGIAFGAWEATVENPMAPTMWSVLSNMCYVVCRVAIMTFYVALIIRGMQSETWRRRLSPITLAGRMPLTNYLLQTVIATFVFFSWGLGLWGTVGPALDLVLAVGIFILIQIPLSRWWLSRFALGPMEYLWRVLTYGRSALRRPAAD